MKIMLRLLTSTIACTQFFGTGCGHELAVIELSNCAKPTASGKQDPLQTPELLELGNEYLDGALRHLSHTVVFDVHTTLRQSSDCFGRALRLSPDSYEAQLSMSVVYLARARLAGEGSSERANLLEGARHMLGSAYMLRHGPYEALYYLSEVAMEEGRLDLARELLEPLRVAGVKEGPVNMLLGRVAEHQGGNKEARAFYSKAVAAGWPPEMAIFAAGRLRQLGTEDE